MIEDIIYNKLLKKPTPEELGGGAGQGADASIVTYSRYPDLNHYISTMEQTRNNHAHRFLYSRRRILGPFILFGKKVVRKLLKWYLEPVAEQQTVFNCAARSAVGRLTELTEALYDRDQQIKQLQEQVAALTEKIQALEDRV